MKRIGYFFISLLLFSNTSCRQDVLLQEEPLRPITFTSSFQTETRATATAFENGDRVGLFIGAPLNRNDIVLTASGTALEPENPLYWPANIKEDTKVSFFAYYPYRFQEGFSPLANATVTLPVNQSSGYAGSDVLSAQTVATPADRSVHLAFHHTFSRFRIRVIDQTSEASFRSLTVGAVKATATVNLSAGTVSPQSGSEQEFTPFNGGNKTFFLLVLPQTVSPVISVKLSSGAVVAYKTDVPIEFAAGKTVSATITLDEDQLRLDYEIVDWDEGDDIHFSPVVDNGETPDPDPLQIEVEYPARLDFGPSISLDDSFVSRISIRTNKNIDLVHICARTSDEWIRVSDDAGALIINGNPSVSERKGAVYLDVLYGNKLFNTVSIPVNQAGVYAYISSPSNISQFDLYADVQLSMHVVAFTPYGGNESVAFASNSDGFLNPLSEQTSPRLVTGDGFVADQSFPSVLSEGQSLTISYGANRSVLQRGCILNYIPFVWVVEDWTAPQETMVPYYVADQNGNAVYESFLALQSPVYVEAEHEDYFALPVSGPNDTYPGYNIFKAYGQNADEVLTDQIVIRSNVGWQQCEQSLPEDDLSYQLSDPTRVSGDGRHLVETHTAMMAGDRLSLFEDLYVWPFRNCYRPDKDYLSRQSAYRVWVDLKDGQSPMRIELARLLQAGVPHVTLLSYDIQEGPRGSYEFEGNTYPFRDQIICQAKFVADALTMAFIKSSSYFCHYQNVEGNIPCDFPGNTEGTFSAYVYSSPDNPDYPLVVRRVILDWSSVMQNDVEILAELPIDDHWTDSPRYAPARPSSAPFILGKDHPSASPIREGRIFCVPARPATRAIKKSGIAPSLSLVPASIMVPPVGQAGPVEGNVKVQSR